MVVCRNPKYAVIFLFVGGGKVLPRRTRRARRNTN